MEELIATIEREAQRVATATGLPLIEAAETVLTVGYEPAQRQQIVTALAERVARPAQSIMTKEQEMQTHSITTEAQPTAYDQMSGLATERAKRTGQTFAQAFDAVLREQPSLYQQYTEEEARLRTEDQDADDPMQRVVAIYHEALMTQAQKDDPTLTHEQAYVLALDKLSPELKADFVGNVR